MNKRTFLKNTAVMTVTSLLLRAMGILFRILLSQRVGAEGIGLYQLVFTVYVLGGTFATGGLTTAVTRLAAEQIARQNRLGLKRIMRLGVLCSLGVGGASALLLYTAAPAIGSWMGDVRTVPAVAVSGLALPFIGISCCLKGYFTARRKALPPCLSQMVEQCVRIGSILYMLHNLWNGSLQSACCIIILGDGLSETAGCLFLMAAYGLDIHRGKGLPQGNAPSAPLWRPLLHIALPLTAGRYLSAALRTAENTLVPARLTLFTRSDKQSLAQFGAVKGMALPLLFFPSSLLMTVSNLLVPELSDANALHHQRQVSYLVERTLHITLLGAVCIGGIFTVFGQQLGDILYHDQTVGLILQILGPLTPVMYLDSAASGMLKGLGQQVHSLGYAVADSVVRILLIWLLLPHYGLCGFLFVMLVSNILTAFLSTWRLLKVSGAAIPWGRWLLCPAFIALIAGIGCKWLSVQFGLIGGLWKMGISALFYILAYGALLPLFRCVTAAEWHRFLRKKA